MQSNLNAALDAVGMTYDSLVHIAEDIASSYTEYSDKLIQKARENVQELSNDTIRTLMFELSLHSYTFSETKEKAALMATCAEILRKEAVAKSFGAAVGSVAVKENIALVESSYEYLAEAVYNLSASLLRVKLDESHRVVDVLKTLLMSRLSEAKLNAVTDNIPTASED